MKNITEDINQILAEWDPIGVGQTIAIDEYREYIPKIITLGKDKELLMSFLEDIIVNEMGLIYVPKDKSFLSEIKQICDKIIQVYAME